MRMRVVMVMLVRLRMVVAMMMVVVIVGMLVMGTLMMLSDHKFRRRHPGPQHLPGIHLEVLDRKTPQRTAQVVEREPRVDERTEQHVPGDPGEAVEVENPASGHSPFDSRKLKYFTSPSTR